MRNRLSLKLFKKRNRVDVKDSEIKRRRTLLVHDGLLATIAAALLVFNAAARGVNLLMALGAFFIGFLAVDFLWGRRILRNLRVTRKLPETVYAGEPFYVEIELDATKRNSSSWAIVVEDSWCAEDDLYDAPRDLKKQAERLNLCENSALDKSIKETKKRRSKKKLTAKQASRTDAALREGVETLKPVVYFPSIHKQEKRKEFYVGVFTRRGIRRLKSLTTFTRFPCGFFRSSEYFDAPDEIVVFPKIGRLTSVWDSFATSHISEETRISASLTSRIPDETVAIRDWRPGDSKRTIAWRATAKRNRLQARDFSKRQSRSIVLVLDLFLPSLGTKKEDEAKEWLNVETAVSFVATLVKKYAEYGDSQLHFALNADVPSFDRINKDKDSIDAMNYEVDAWNTIISGSTRRVSTLLALATPSKVDRLNETMRVVESLNLRDAQVFVVSIGPIDRRRFDENCWKNVCFVDVSSPQFVDYFQWN